MLSTRTSLGIAGILLASPRALRLLVLTGDGTASPASRSLPVSAAAERFTVVCCCICPYPVPVCHPPPRSRCHHPCRVVDALEVNKRLPKAFLSMCRTLTIPFPLGTGRMWREVRAAAGFEVSSEPAQADGPENLP